MTRRAYTLTVSIAVLATVVVVGGVSYLAIRGTQVPLAQNSSENVAVSSTSTQPHGEEPVEQSTSFPPAIENSLAVPPLYSGYEWSAVSTSSSEVLAVDTPLQYASPSLHGMLYEATNTNPSGSYNFNQQFFSYYRSVLAALGYGRSSLSFDINWNLVDTNWSSAITPIEPMIGPEIVGGYAYIKYSGKSIRVIIVSSDVQKNTVFVSDIYNLQDLLK